MKQRTIERKKCFATSRFVVRVCVMLLGIFLVVAPASDAAACPTCKQSLASGHDGVSLGCYWSILFMIAMPFLIFGGWALFSGRAIKLNAQVNAIPHTDFPQIAGDFAE